MKPLCRWLWPLLLAALPLLAQATATEEKIIFIRHGEKPALGLGMLNCQGLNRALALPAVLVNTFGKPDFVFASDPHEQKVDGGQPYNYVRPLLTVAPTAVQLGLPINTAFGYDDIAALQQELAEPRYHAATVLVAWEHKMIEDLVTAMLKQLGSTDTVPHWKGDDFDSIYVVTVRRDGAATRASFTQEHEHLNGQATACPAATPHP